MFNNGLGCGEMMALGMFGSKNKSSGCGINGKLEVSLSVPTLNFPGIKCTIVENKTNMIDESQLPYEEQSLVYRLRKRAEIRRNSPDRLSKKENKPDRMADLLEEAANEIEKLRGLK